MVESITQYFLTAHAKMEMQRRGIPEETVKFVLGEPEQRSSLRSGREVLQSRVAMAGKLYLVRVIVEVDRAPAEVVTVYRTSKISKYWRTES